MGKKSFAFLGALIIILILATFGVGVVVFISSRNQGTISQITSSKALYSLQAGIEFAERKLRATGENIPIGTLAGTYEFGNTTFTLSSGGGNTVIVSGSEENAYSQFQLDIPQVTQGGCLIVNTDDADREGKKVKNIELKRDPSCSISLTITALTALWNPDHSEHLDRIKIEEGPFEYDDDVGITSGGTALFESHYPINNNQ